MNASRWNPGWIVAGWSLLIVAVGALVGAETGRLVAEALFVAALLLVPLTAFVASRVGRNALFGALVLGCAPLAAAVGVELAYRSAWTWMSQSDYYYGSDKDAPFWIASIWFAVLLTPVGLVIGAFGVLSRRVMKHV